MIRLLSPEGTLVVEVDDPEILVTIDGADVVITGAGVKEVRLSPGSYKVEASKDGKLVSQELVNITRNGRQVVRISREPLAGGETVEVKAAVDTATWERDVAALPVEEREQAVVARLRELNPGGVAFLEIHL